MHAYSLTNEFPTGNVHNLHKHKHGCLGGGTLPLVTIVIV